jgi:hypothetical protein
MTEMVDDDDDDDVETARYYLVGVAGGVIGNWFIV